MKPRTLLVLAVLLAGLTAFWWFYERELPGSDERAKLAKKLLPLEVEDVTALTIEWDGKKVRLEKETPAAKTDEENDEDTTFTPPAKWRLLEPLQAKADEGAVNGLVSSLLGLDKERTFDDADKKALGLDPPRARVTVATAAGERVVEIGGEVPAASTMAVATGGSEAFLVGKYVYSQLTKAPGDWRSKEVFPATRDAVERIKLMPPAGEPILLAERGEEHWLEAPISDRADRDLVGGLLTTLTTLRVEEFVDEESPDLAARGLAPAAGRLEVVLAGHTQPFVVELGAPVDPVAADGTTTPAGKRYLRATSDAGSLLFTATADLATALARPVAEWQSKAWSSLEVYQVDKLVVDEADGKLEVMRDGGDWRRGGKDGEKIAYTPVSDLLYAVTGVRAARLVSEPAAGLGEPTLTLELTGTGETPKSDTLTVYSARGEEVPVRSAGRDTTLLVAASALADLRDKLQLVRNAEPLPGEPGEGGGSAVGAGSGEAADDGKVVGPASPAAGDAPSEGGGEG